MLSILIPTYNFPCLTLVEALVRQAQTDDIACEIIVADDASPDEQVRTVNRAIGALPLCTFMEMPCNVGRARIRNRLAEEAKGEWLLFMDCDAQVVSPHFLQHYVSMTTEAPVLCGGLQHPEVLPHPDVTLRYAYEKKADLHRSAEERREHPYDCFTTFCFAIRRDTFLRIRFDENCRDYGYEDTLFGEELKRRNIPICHFDNHLIHIGLEDNTTFLKKTETALQSLVNLQRRGIRFHSRLVHKYAQLRRYGLHRLLPLLFWLTAPMLRSNLLGKHPHLPFFACYKLGYYARLQREGV